MTKNKIIVTIFIAAISLSGCGTTALQRLSGASFSAKQVETLVLPKWNAKCTATIAVCNKENKSQSECTEYLTCDKNRHLFITALIGVHTGVAQGAPLATLEKYDVTTIVDITLKALQNVYDLATEAGFLGKVK